MESSRKTSGVAGEKIYLSFKGQKKSQRIMKPLSSLLCCREVLGLGTGLIMLLELPWRVVMVWEPGWLLLVLLVIACMAGFAGGAVSVQQGNDPSSALRFGAWTAFLSALVAASIFALSSRLMESWFFVFKAGTAGVLSLLPVTFYGMVCSGIAALTLARQDAPTNPAIPATPPSSAMIWSLRAFIALLVVLAIVLPPASPLRFVAPLPSPQLQRPVQTAAPPPAFAFTPSPDIEHASAMQWRLLKQREVSGVDESTLALSPDDRYVACVAREQQAVQVIDLRTEAVWRVNLPGKVEHFSFDPTGARLLAVWLLDGERFYGVADIRGGHVTTLPKPRKGIVPSGTPFWWKDTKVLVVQNQDRLMLNLDNLEIDDAAQDEEWKSLDPLIQQKLTREVVPALMDKAQWQWEVRRFIRRSELPEIAGQSQWPLTLERCLAISHPLLDCMTVFPSLDVKEGERLCSTRDGSVVLRPLGGVLHLYYFDVEPLPDLVWKIVMPHSPEDGEHAKEVARALEAGQLAALVYRPMINPLNQQVVGPLREEALGVLRFLEWKGKEATVYLWQRRYPIKQGDIIADVCSLTDEPEGELLTLNTPHRWWSRLPATNSGALTPPKTSLRHEQTAAVKKRESEQNAEQVARDAVERRKREEAEAASARVAAEKTAAMEAERKAAAEKAALTDEVAPKLKDMVVRFVAAHHKKSLEGDVQGMVADYADKVDYFTNGMVDRAWILRDEATYHNSHLMFEEKVIGDVTVKHATQGDGYEVSYKLRVQAQNMGTRKPVDGIFSVRLVITHTSEGMRIILHHSVKEP
jgi:hypothetical protein